MILLKNIYIDEFKYTNITPAITILTHWHGDHYKSLPLSFTGVVYASKITSNMIKTFRPKVKISEIEVGKFIPNIPYEILVLDANHIPGSIMLYIPKYSIFYTGDYRLNSDMLNDLKMSIGNVNTFYVDGTFHNKQIKCFSEKQSIHTLCTFIKRHHDLIYIGIRHIGTCTLLVKCGLKFQIDPSLSAYTDQQIRLMYSKHVVPSSRFVVTNPNTYDPIQHTVIIPSSLWFLCKKNPNQSRYDIVKDHNGFWRMNYTCHSDYHDNMLLYSELHVQNMQILNTPKFNLSCT